MNATASRHLLLPLFTHWNHWAWRKPSRWSVCRATFYWAELGISLSGKVQRPPSGQHRLATCWAARASRLLIWPPVALKMKWARTLMQYGATRSACPCAQEACFIIIFFSVFPSSPPSLQSLSFYDPAIPFSILDVGRHRWRDSGSLFLVAL